MRLLFVKLFFLFSCFAAAVYSDLAEEAQTYCLSQSHPMYDALDRIFTSSKILDSDKNLLKAGFVIIQHRDPDLIIAKHPALPGRIIKLHLHSSSRSEKSQWKNFIARCKNAKALHDFIEEKHLRYFVVPEKWIYATEDGYPVLIATYMDIFPEKETTYAWKHFAREKQVKELHMIIRAGLGSSKLIENVPYTRQGVFACIDTEKPSQGDSHLKKHLSSKMQKYWDKLTREEKK